MEKGKTQKKGHLQWDNPKAGQRKNNTITINGAYHRKCSEFVIIVQGWVCRCMWGKGKKRGWYLCSRSIQRWLTVKEKKKTGNDTCNNAYEFAYRCYPVEGYMASVPLFENVEKGDEIYKSLSQLAKFPKKVLNKCVANDYRTLSEDENKVNDDVDTIEQESTRSKRKGEVAANATCTTSSILQTTPNTSNCSSRQQRREKYLVADVAGDDNDDENISNVSNVQNMAGIQLKCVVVIHCDDQRIAHRGQSEFLIEALDVGFSWALKEFMEQKKTKTEEIHLQNYSKATVVDSNATTNATVQAINMQVYVH
eukprot:15365793-Ditylum_brightwellii.AAC.2